MDIDDYQVRAANTAQFDFNDKTTISISLLGLAGEVGELLTEFKKEIRDGESYKVFTEKVLEEIGDVMWYLASIATHKGILLSDALAFSQSKTEARWKGAGDLEPMLFEDDHFDDEFEEAEQFPREFVIDFIPQDDGTMVVHVNNELFGNELSDNAHDPDYYRLHDIFHFSYVTVLGWSPVARKLLGRKRRSCETTDEIEDGGRAAVIDEAISALVFEHAKKYNFFDGAGGVDYSLLRTIQDLTQHLEVRRKTPKEWEKAILLGFDVWREIKALGGGKVICDMGVKTMRVENNSSTSNTV